MAGSISFSLSQQFDRLGKPLANGKLYFFEAESVATPQNAYKDYGLTLEHPNPITLDASGRVPAFYLDDGFIKIRLTDAQGVIQIEQDSLLVIGPSSGEGGGGGGVDSTTVFQTGDVLWLDVSGTRTGWVRDNGRTIGNALSGATERANSDTSALFVYLWGTYSNTICPVSGGRGASAAADFAAAKTITLPDKRGYVPGGLDDMGNSAASRYSGVPVVSGSTTTAGSVLGETTHVLTDDEMANHDHGGASGSASPTVTLTKQGTDAVYGGFGATYIMQSTVANALVSVTGATAAHTHSISAAGNDAAHNNVQKTVLGTFYRKL